MTITAIHEPRPTWLCKRYVLPSIKGEGWGEIILCSSGMFAAVSDYGNYAFLWSHHGCDDFREFFAGRRGFKERTDFGYFLGKLNPGDEYDGAATLKNAKRQILNIRRGRVARYPGGVPEGVTGGAFSSEEARDEWELLEENSDLRAAEDFAVWAHCTKLNDVHELLVYRTPAMVKAFCERLLPRLVEVLRAEMKAEDEQAKVEADREAEYVARWEAAPGSKGGVS